MTLSITRRITLFWTTLLLGVTMLFATDAIPALHDHEQFSRWLFLIPIFCAVILFARLYRDFPAPWWIRVSGGVILAVALFGIPTLSVSRGPENFPPLFLICFASALGAFFVVVTVYALRQRDDLH
jgi:hypothetical protein